MFHYVYVLQSIYTKKLYIGYTIDLKKRFKQHNNGESPATKPYIPYELICYEAFRDRKDAIDREEYLKSGWGLRSLKKMLENFLKE